MLAGNVFGVSQPALSEAFRSSDLPGCPEPARQHHGSLAAPSSHELHASPPPGSRPSPNALAGKLRPSEESNHQELYMRLMILYYN